MTAVTDAATTIAWTILQGAWLAALLAVIYWIGIARNAVRPEWRARCAMSALIALSLASAVSAVVTWRSLRVAEPGDRGTAVATALIGASVSHVAPTASISQQPAPAQSSRGAWSLGRIAVERYMRASYVVAALWLCAVAFLLLRLGWSTWRVTALRRLVRNDPTVDYSSVAQLLGISPAPVVCVTKHVATPCVIGWRRPVVLMPEWATGRVSEAGQRMIVAHELAHVGRNDYRDNVVQRIVEAVHFFNPAVWWLSGSLRNNRELACDLAAIRATRASPIQYAQTLVSLELLRSGQMVPDVSFSGGALLPRVRSLVESSVAVPRRTHRSGTRLAVVAVVAAAFIVLTLRLASAAPVYAATLTVDDDSMETRIRLGRTGVLLSNPSHGAPSRYAGSVCGADVGHVEDRRDVLADGTGTWLVAWRGVQCEVRLQLVGDIEIDLLRGEITRRRAGASLIAAVTRAGGVDSLRVDDSVPRLSPAQRQWLRRVFDDVDAHAGVNAPLVVPRLLSRGGIAHAIDYAGALATPYARWSYLTQIVERSDGHNDTTRQLHRAVDSLRLLPSQQEALHMAIERRVRGLPIGDVRS